MRLGPLILRGFENYLHANSHGCRVPNMIARLSVDVVHMLGLLTDGRAPKKSRHWKFHEQMISVLYIVLMPSSPGLRELREKSSVARLSSLHLVLLDHGRVRTSGFLLESLKQCTI